MSRFTIKIDDRKLIGCNCKNEAKDFDDELLLKVLNEIIPVLQERINDKLNNPHRGSKFNIKDFVEEKDIPKPPDNSFDLSTFIIMCG